MRLLYTMVIAMDGASIRNSIKGPTHCPVDNFENVIEEFTGKGMSVFVTRCEILLPEGIHAHENYEFLIPILRMPLARVERKKLTVDQNKLLPINSEQFHGNVRQSNGCRFIALEMEKDFLQEIAHAMCGMQKELFFHNENLKLDRYLQNMINLFILEATNHQAGYEFVLESLCTQIAVNMLRQAKNNLPLLLRERNYVERDNIKRIIEFLQEKYNEDYSLEDMARLANLSPYHFIRVFKAQTGKTPYEFLLDIKIENAKELLRFANRNITEICFLCGFKNPSHFAAIFKRRVGVSPSEYRGAFLGK